MAKLPRPRSRPSWYLFWIVVVVVVEEDREAGAGGGAGGGDGGDGGDSDGLQCLLTGVGVKSSVGICIKWRG